ncbi:hypothetical protein DBR28_08685 [Chryseobacterium sp. HMWF028]|nr:hypothetical protein DBR28_08685 [Chryseobacterium sp. HMWF028]
MPVQNDTPKDIYVRDIGESELEAFIVIKNKLGFTSNNKTIQALFLKYLSLERENDRLKTERNNLLEKKRKLETIIYKVKDFANVLNSFQDD